MAQIDVVLNFIDKLSAPVKNAVASLSTPDGLASAAIKASVLMTGLNQTMGVARTVVNAAQQAYQQTVGAVMDYNKQVLDLSRNIGASTEETSKLIQISDDAGISMQSVATAMEMMTKRGMAPTVESMAQMADAFVSITDPVERAAYLTERLGRNWSELTPLLAQGGDEIRDAADNVSENLIVTKESAEATEEWRLQVDELNDSLEGLKMTMGGWLIKGLSSAAYALKMLTGAGKEYVGALQEHNDELLTSTTTYEEYAAEMQRSLDYLNYSVDAEGNVTDALGRHIGTLQVLTEEQYNNREINAQMAAGYAAMKASIEGTNAGLGSLASTMPGVTELMASYNDRLLFTIASQGMTAEGALALARSMGMIDQKTELAYDAVADYKKQLDEGKISAGEYNIKLGLMREALEKLDGKTYKTALQLEMEIQQAFEEMKNLNVNQGAGQQMAAGGSFVVPPGYPMDSYPLGGGVWAQSGERVTVTPGGDSRGAKSGGVTINLYNTIASEIDAAAFEQRVINVIKRYTL